MTADEGSEDTSEGRWVTEAAELTGRHPNTIRNWVRDRRLQHVREEPYSGGTRYLLSEDEMQTMIAIQMAASGLVLTLTLRMYTVY